MTSKHINDTLSEREKTYGSFEGYAVIASKLKAVIAESLKGKDVPPWVKESLDMQASKQARILNGDFRHVDSWHDISGYAELGVKALENEF